MAHISIENLTVEFAIFGANARSLKNKILAQATGGRVMSGAHDVITVRAVDGLNLEINDGDRVGLVGHNGSGKTTLLRVLAGIYKPNGGAITIEGQVGAILDSSAGMDPELTGIENIYLRGYMIGMSRRRSRPSSTISRNFLSSVISSSCRCAPIPPACPHGWPLRFRPPRTTIFY